MSTSSLFTFEIKILVSLLLFATSSTTLAQISTAVTDGDACRRIGESSDEIDGQNSNHEALKLAKVACVKALQTYGATKSDYQARGINTPDVTTSPGAQAFANRNFSQAEADVLGDIVDSSLEKLRRDRRDTSSSRFSGLDCNIVPGSFFDRCRLRQSNVTNSTGLTRPASFAYTLNNNGEDGIVIASAFSASKYSKKLDAHFSLETEYQRNNQQTQEQNNFNIGLVALIDFSGDSRAYKKLNSPLTGNSCSDADKGEKDSCREEARQLARHKYTNDFPSSSLAIGLNYNRTGIFGNPESAACVTDPDAQFCGTQNLRSLRLSATYAPYLTGLEGTLPRGSWPSKKRDRIWYYGISPSFALFHDEALNNNVVSEAGASIDGGVLGINSSVTASLSPGFFQNRVELSLTGQVTQALSRDNGRVTEDAATNFERTSSFVSASIQLALAEGSFVGQTQRNGIIPTIGFTYTRGSDILRGRRNQDSFVVSLNIEF